MKSALDLQITDSLKTGDGHNARLLTVHATAPPDTGCGMLNGEMVAKVFDPLYFVDYDDGYLDPFLCMNKILHSRDLRICAH